MAMFFAYHKSAGRCENCTGLLKIDWLTKELFHAQTGMNNCPFSKDTAKRNDNG